MTSQKPALTRQSTRSSNITGCSSTQLTEAALYSGSSFCIRHWLVFFSHCSPCKTTYFIFEQWSYLGKCWSFNKFSLSYRVNHHRVYQKGEVQGKYCHGRISKLGHCIVKKGLQIDQNVTTNNDVNQTSVHCRNLTS